jgi:hypothetical protein
MEQRDTDLLRELKTLRKGRGVNTARVSDQIGPHLRELVAVEDHDPAGIIRQKLTGTLNALAESLPADLALAARAALALHPDAQQPFLAERVQWLADRLERDVRTARRRVDLGLAALAERAQVPGPAEAVVPAPRVAAARGCDDDAWHIREFRAVLRLDQPAPEAIEQRVVVANEDGLDRLDALITIPRDRAARTGPHDLLVEVLYGATIISRERVTGSRFKFGLQLPRALYAGEAHEYGLLFRLPPDQPMRTHYVYTTHRRCDAFDLRVRFDPERMPAQVWRVNQAYSGDLDDERAPRDVVDVDRTGEIHLVFHRLRLGFGYGAQWAPLPPPAIRPGVEPAARSAPGDAVAGGST